MPEVKSKLPNIGQTIFTVMSQLAQNEKAINLSQGFPGFDCDSELQKLVSHFMQKGHNQYAPMSGMPKLREAIAEKTRKTLSINVDPDSEITVTSGATEALFAAITATVHAGDEVIVFEPAYDSYQPAIELSGGIPVFIPLTMPDFSIDWDLVKSKVSDKARLIIINTPHNPSGYVWTSDDLAQLAAIVEDKCIYILSDEVYEHIVFDGRKHLSLLSHPQLRKKSFVCSSFGKTFHITGWKIGYCIAPKALTVELRKVHQYLTFSTSTPMQLAIAEYLEEESRYLKLSAFYQQKRDLFCEGLKSTPFKFFPAQGSFFQLVEYGHLTDCSDLDLAVRLTKENKVASIPISVFYSGNQDPKMLRFCFAKRDEELLQALDRLQKANI
ncbi:methionine aminotransferase [Litoribacter ruber]|uniref:methionine aminotransferase n=1 Tax=Litoribacter ruber TaxID=702568 RepID=UPI00293D200A|nr:methionine aminotransferase [Litoribacter alkaliphilus]